VFRVRIKRCGCHYWAAFFCGWSGLSSNINGGGPFLSLGTIAGIASLQNNPSVIHENDRTHQVEVGKLRLMPADICAVSFSTMRRQVDFPPVIVLTSRTLESQQCMNTVYMSFKAVPMRKDGMACWADVYHVCPSSVGCLNDPNFS
jgi:hypothetical protein